MTNRGIAVFSGSSAVVAKIMENKTAVFGQDVPIDLRISGNLVLDLSGSTAPGYLFVNNQGTASLTNALIGNISASNVYLQPSGNLVSSNVQDGLYELQTDVDNILATTGGGIIREIQAGSNIGVLNGTSPTASIFLSSSLTNLISVQSQQITASSITASVAIFTSITGNLFGTSSFATNAGNANTVTNGVYTNANNTFTAINTFNNFYITGSITGSDAKFTNITGSHAGSGAGLTNIPNAALVNSSVTVGSTNIALGDNATTIQGITVLTGSTVTGSIALFSQITGAFSGSGRNVTNITASNISNFTNDVRSQFSAGTNITIVGGVISSTGGGATPGGIDTSIQFNSGSSLSGSANLVYDYNTNTLSGTTAQFSTITASNITIGEAEDGTYADGLFTTFTATTPVGLVVDRFNEVLKGLAPSQAPSLSNIERNTAGGNSVNLSFGNSSPTASYFNVTASLAGLANVDIGGAYSVINGPGGNPIRLGAFTALTALTATLNNNIAANAGAFTNYPARSFNVSADGVGSYIIEMNDVILTPTGSTINTSSYLANNFALSLANTASFIGTGLAFDLFRHRTGSVSIPTASWRLGENYFRVTHVSSLGTHVTNFVDWVYDPQAATGNSVYGFTTTSSSFTVSGLKELSGIKYYQTCSFNFTSSISNYYKNVYSQAANGGITFGSLTSGLTATAFTSTPAPANSDVALQRSSLHTLAGVRVLSGTLASTMSVANGLGKTGTSVLTTPTILFDNINTANTNTLENFCFEDFRVVSASYDTQASLTTAGNYASGSSLATTELAVYNGAIVYPTQIFNAGNVAGSGIIYMLGGQPNYAGVTQDRFYLRRFVNGISALATFNLVLTGSNINFTTFGGALTGNAVKIAIKVPGKTGWRDVMTAAPPNTTGIALNDNVGCLAGSAPSNITTAAGRSISINLLTEAVGASESYIVRVLTSNGWTGTITRLQIA
jgi:hypothetical protein